MVAVKVVPDRASVAPFAARVIAWQRTHGRHDLPWQNTGDPYRIWISEVMLQQTQVATVLPYYTRFVAAFPSVDALASAPVERVLEHWSGLGYYRRAHHLHAAAEVVVARHAGRFPTDAATLGTLPGVGRSTAAAIAAFASGERVAILDGNVKRLLARHHGIEGWPGLPRIADALWRATEARLPLPDPSAPSRGDEIGAYTQGLMDLGTSVCTRARPRCDACPVNEDCVARRESRIDALPTPRPKRNTPQRAVAALLVECNGEWLLERRPPVGVWGGLWSLPEVALHTDIVSYVAMRFQSRTDIVECLAPLTHAFTHFTLTMYPHRVAISERPPVVEAPGVAWFTRQGAIAAAIPAPVRKLLQGLPTTGH